MKKDALITVSTELVVLVAGMLVFKVAAYRLGTEQFSVYALSRRTSSLILPALIMGLGVGIPRYIALADAKRTEGGGDAYFVSGLAAISGMMFAITLISITFKDKLGLLFFGKNTYNNLMYPLVLLLAGLLLHSSCYSYFRGKLLMRSANILQLANLAIVPLSATCMGKNVEQMLIVTGVGCIATSCLVLGWLLKQIEFDAKLTLSRLKELLQYGLQRVPGDFGMAAILSLPSTIITHKSGVQEAGALAFAVSLLTMFGAPIAPLGLIMLPKATQIIGSGDRGRLINIIIKTNFITILYSVVALAIFNVFGSDIIKIFLGAGFEHYVVKSRELLTSLIFYNLYVCNRSYVDACYVQAINTKNIIISLALLCILMYMIEISMLNISVILAMTISLMVLSVITIVFVYRIANNI